MPRPALLPNPVQIQKFHVYCSTNWHDALLVLLVTSAAALCYNLCHSLTIKRTSAVTVCVLGEIKIVGLLILSALLLGEAPLCISINGE